MHICICILFKYRAFFVFKEVLKRSACDHLFLIGFAEYGCTNKKAILGFDFWAMLLKQINTTPATFAIWQI